VKTLCVSLLLAICSTGVSAQDVTARLAGRVPPDVAALVRQLATSAAARGLPVDPLIQKAIEGSAKGVPSDRVATALRGLVAQLDVAAAALRDADPAQPDTDAIAAGAFAVNAGLSGEWPIAQGGRDAAGSQHARGDGRSPRPDRRANHQGHRGRRFFDGRARPSDAGDGGRLRGSWPRRHARAGRCRDRTRSRGPRQRAGTAETEAPAPLKLLPQRYEPHRQRDGFDRLATPGSARASLLDAIGEPAPEGVPRQPEQETSLCSPAGR